MMMAGEQAAVEAGGLVVGATRGYVCPQRDQMSLLPVCMRDWLEEGHLAWFVLDAVAELDTSASHRRPGGCPGRPPYEPEMMCALAIPRRADPQRPVIGDQRLGRLAVPRVPGPSARRLPGRIPQMRGQLRLERPIQEPAGELRQHPVGPSDLLRGARARQQRIQKLIRDLRLRLAERRAARQPRQRSTPATPAALTLSTSSLRSSLGFT